ncbi:MAG: phosphonoacetaldehyde hydrolase [Hyphomonas sp.]
MSNQVKAVIFDWAGTVVDFGSRAPVRAMAKVFAEEGIPVSEPLIRKYMGYAKRDHVAAILSEPEGRSAWNKVKEAPWNEADVDRLLERLIPAMAQAAADCAALVPRVRETFDWLTGEGIRIGSTTGYSRSMMDGILPRAAEQGYTPEVIICAGETAAGRPAPLMIWKALEMLKVWPVSTCVKVDDTAVGIEAGVNAGTWTIGVAGSGNGVGLSLEAFRTLSAQHRIDLMRPVATAFEQAGADFVLESVAGVPGAIQRITQLMSEGKRPGGQRCEHFL